MKSTVKLLVSLLALGGLALAPTLLAQEKTVPGAFTPPDEQPASPAKGKAGKAGKGGRAAQLDSEQRIAALDQALSLTADQKAKILEIYAKAAAQTRTDIRAVLTDEQQKKFDAESQTGAVAKGGKVKGKGKKTP